MTLPETGIADPQFAGAGYQWPGPEMEPEPEEPPRELHFDAVNLTLRLSPERKLKLARRLGDALNGFYDAIDPRLQNLVQWRHDWEVVPPPPSGRFEGAAAIPSPNTRIYCNAHHSKLNGQILNASPPFTAIARKPQAMEVVATVEEALNSYLEEAEWRDVADDVHNELAVAGNVYLRTYYEKKWERVPRREVETDPEAARSVLLATGDLHEAYWAGAKGVKFTHKDELVYDGVKFRVIPFEDGVILPPTIRDPDDAYAIGERYVLRGSDLKQGVRDGLYYPAAVTKLLEMDSDPPVDERDERLQDIGLDLGSWSTEWDDDDYAEYTVYELFFKGDWDNDGKQEWAVLFFHRESETLIGARYLEDEHGRPPVTLFRYIRRPKELFGMGIAELVACYQDGDTDIRCQLVDHGNLALNWNGNFAYTSMAGLRPGKTPARLGTPILMDNINEIRDLPKITYPNESYAMSQRFKEDCELLTSASNPSLGRTSDADKTLGEVQIVVSNSNSIFEEYAARVSRTWARVWDQVRWLVAQYGEREPETGHLTYRRTAENDTAEFALIDPEWLKRDIDLVPAGLEQLSDLQTRIQQATITRSSMMGDPLVVGNNEAGLLIAKYYLETMKIPIAKKLLASMERQKAALDQVQQLEGQYTAQAADEMAKGGMLPPGPNGAPGEMPPPGPGGPTAEAMMPGSPMSGAPGEGAMAMNGAGGAMNGAGSM